MKKIDNCKLLLTAISFMVMITMPISVVAQSQQDAETSNEAMINNRKEAVQTSDNIPLPLQVIDLDKNLSAGEEYIVEKELVFENPFGSEALAKQLEEYSRYEMITNTKKFPTDRGNTVGYQPVWEKGLTVSYWIKASSDEEGNYLPAGVLRWELDQELCEANDYARYLTSQYYDILLEKMSKEEKAEALYEESGVLPGSPYYFKYLETEGMNADGAPVAREHTENGLTGPVYDSRYLEPASGPKTQSIYYAYNPLFRRGFLRLADGSYTAQLEETAGGTANYYTQYHTLDVEEGSMVRRADVHGELQLDITNSIYWIPDDGNGVNKNPNTNDAGTKRYMQEKNCFYLNSWYIPYGQETEAPGRYQDASQVAASPVTAIDASGSALKNGNCGTWHQVTVTFQNDWVEFYVDGVCADVERNYGVLGNEVFGDEFQRLNKGTGLRGMLGARMGEFQWMNISRGNYVCQLLMEWLTDEDATLHIGGAGQYAGRYNQAAEANPFSLDDVYFYDQLLTDKQIQAAYEQQMAAREGKNRLLGDIDGNGSIDLRDAQIALKCALKILSLNKQQSACADLDHDGTVSLTDAQILLKKALKIIS